MPMHAVSSNAARPPRKAAKTVSTVFRANGLIDAKKMAKI
jgi:hypothetical protein